MVTRGSLASTCAAPAPVPRCGVSQLEPIFPRGPALHTRAVSPRAPRKHCDGMLRLKGWRGARIAARRAHLDSSMTELPPFPSRVTSSVPLEQHLTMSLLQQINTEIKMSAIMNHWRRHCSIRHRKCWTECIDSGNQHSDSTRDRRSLLQAQQQPANDSNGPSPAPLKPVCHAPFFKRPGDVSECVVCD